MAGHEKHEKKDDKMNVNPIEIEKYLKGFDYPGKKDDLVKHARKNGAPAEIVDVLKHLPEEEYTRPTDVTKAFKEAA